MSDVPTFAEAMNLTSTVGSFHCLQPLECQAMYETLCDLPEGAVIVEVGCDYGRSSSLIFQLAKAKKFVTIHIDPWQEYQYRARQWMEVMCERCMYHPFILLRMSTVEAQPIIERLAGNRLDMAFIDGCHDQPVVEMDLKIVGNRIRQGGFLTAHDYPSGGVTEAIDPYVAQGWEKVRHSMGFAAWRRV